MQKRVILLILLFLAIFIANVNASHRETEVVKAVKVIKDSVINIRTEKIVKKTINPFFDDPFFNEFFGFKRTYKTQSIGSGFFIKSDGTAVTNYHVIEAASTIFVVTGSDEQYSAEYIGGDRDLDIAIIKVKGVKDIIPVKLGTSSDLMLGETVIAMGNPYGLESSVSTGVISNTQRFLNIENKFAKFIQIDAPINPGNSGGPLVNLDGEVIGINSAIYREAQGIGFSIPIDILNRILNEILVYKKIRQSYIGILLEETADGLLKVDMVEKNSPAESINIKRGDILYKVDNTFVTTLGTFKYILKTFPPNSSIEVVVKRGDKYFRGLLKTTSMPKDYGIHVLNLLYGIKLKEAGDYVQVSASNIPAYLKKDDIILEINSKEIKNLNDLNETICDSLYGDAVFTIYRNNQIIKFKIQL
jgi:S1-C subfamily serine protease